MLGEIANARRESGNAILALESESNFLTKSVTDKKVKTAIANGNEIPTLSGSNPKVKANIAAKVGNIG